MNCNIEVKLGNTDPKILDSDMELDKLLESQAPKLLESWYKIKDVNKLDKIFSLADDFDKSIDILKQISKAYDKAPKSTITNQRKKIKDVLSDSDFKKGSAGIFENLDDYVDVDHLDASLSVSKLVESVGNKHDLYKPTVTGMNNKYKLYFKNSKKTFLEEERLELEKELKKNENIWSQSEINAFKKNIKSDSQISKLVDDLWELESIKGERAALIGEDIHYILECLFNEKDVDIKNFGTLTENQYNKYKNTIESIYKNIKSRFSDRAKFFTEFSIVSKDLPTNVKRALKNAGYDNVSKIAGRIDLMVIDENGKVHLFDWKTSAKKVGDWKETDNRKLQHNSWWPSTKKLKAFAQLGNYAAILEQYGLQVESAEIVPIFVDFESNEGSGFNVIKTLEQDTSVDYRMSNSYCTTQKRYARYTFSVTRPVKIGELTNIGLILNNIFPGTNLDSQHVKHFEATIDFYKNKKGFVNPVKKGTDAYDKGFRFKFFKNGLPDKGVVMCKTEEELNDKLGKYVQELNDYMHNQMGDFAEDLSNVIHTQGDKNKIDAWYESFSLDSRKFLENTFRKYYTNGWQITINESLNNNGVFIFKKNNQIDIVALSEKDLHHICPIKSAHGKNNTNILGFALDDGQEGTDPFNTMTTQFGNLMLMKMAALVAYHPDIIDDAKINSIKIINPWHRTSTDAHSNKYLIDNWNAITTLYKDEKLPTLNENLFHNDIDACIHEAAELIHSQDLELHGDILQAKSEQKEYDADTIIKLMYKIRKTFKNDYDKPSTLAGEAYYQLQLALLHTKGIHVYEEPDVADYVDRGVWFTGNMVSAAEQSSSTNVRMLGKIFGQYRDVYTEKFNQKAEIFLDLVNDVYKEWGFNKSPDNASNFWKILYDDLDSMKFKHPNHPDFKDKKATKKLLNVILESLYLAKNPNILPEDLEEASAKDEYYEVPLLEAGLSKTIYKNYKSNGIKGIFNGVWEVVKEAGNKLDTLYSGVNQEKTQGFQDSLENNEVFNKYLEYTQDERTKLLDSNKAWETNIEKIYLATMAAVSIKEASKSYGQFFVAYHSALTYLHKYCGLDIKKIHNFSEKWINNKVFMRQIMDDSLNLWNSIIKVARKTTSMVTLGLSTRAMTREFLVSMYTSYTRIANNQLPGITSEIFSDAMWYVVKQAPISFNIQNMIAALNKQYAMSNYSRDEMAETSRSAHWGLQNMDPSDVFITSKLSDNYFRMSILIAKMKADGCFDAHREEEGELIYDFSKDLRFNLYANNDKSDVKKWKQQEDLYLKYLQEWQQVYPELNLREGDPLPQAYPPSIKASIRLMANELFGFFDAEDKSLLTATFLGGAFMQYKTWLSAKLNQHMKSPGFTNMWKYIPRKDADGDELWMVAASDEELSQGIQPLRYVKKQDVLDEWIEEGRAVPWMMEEGTYQEGTILATGEFLKDILTWNLESFKKHWSDPMKRGQLINGLEDTFGMLIVIGIIQAVFGEDVTNNRADQDWITQWSYGVLMGFAEDGPVNKIISSTFSDVNPPSLLTLQKWADTVNSVLAGNKSIGQGLVESFGATREFRGYFR